MNDTKLMISTLRQGKTGEEILRILDAITDNPVESVMQTDHFDLWGGIVVVWLRKPHFSPQSFSTSEQLLFPSC